MRRLHWTVLSIFTALFLLHGVCSADENATENKPSDYAEITAAFPHEWVAGTRLWVPVTIKNLLQRSINGPLLQDEPFQSYDFSYELRSAEDGKVIAKVDYSLNVFEQDMMVDEAGNEFSRPRPYFIIEPGKELRLLFPLSWPEDVAVEPGEYELVLSIYALFPKLGSPAPVRVVVRNPTKDEKAILNTIPSKYILSVNKRSDILDNLELPKSLAVGTGVGFEFLLYKLSHIGEAAKDIDVGTLMDNVNPMFAPEVAVLKYEILLQQGNAEDAARLRKETLAKNPGIAFQFEKVDAGNGLVAAHPKQSSSVSEEETGDDI